MNVVSLYGSVYKNPLITRDDENGEIVKCAYLLLLADGEYGEMVPINCYGKVAQFVATNVKQGMRIAVTGKLKNVKKDDGYKLIIVAIKNEFDDGRNIENDMAFPLG